MQDFTGVPAVVDLAAMRDAMVALGGDPEKINPLNPVDLVIDHSVMVDEFGNPRAFQMNVDREYERNFERYQFLKWGQGAFDNFRVVPPGTGICHQVNLEYLAQAVWTRQGPERRRGRLSRHAGRHRQPHDDGQRHGGARLGRRRHRGRGGDAGPADLDADPRGRRLQADRRAEGGRDGDRPGADGHADAAQARRGRQVRRVLRRRHGPPAAGRPGDHRQHGAGIRRDLRLLPDRPGDAALHGDDGPRRRRASSSSRPMPRRTACGAARITTRSIRRRWRSTSATSCRRWPGRSGRRTRWRCRTPRRPSPRSSPTSAQAAPKEVPVAGADYKIRDGSVVIAAITSCTNTSNPYVMIGAGLVARKAREKGLTRKPWVKTSLAPGSQVVSEYLQAAGLQEDLDAIGYQPGRLWLHDLHRQFRAAARADLERDQRGGPGGLLGAVGQPQLRGAGQSGLPCELPRLAAAGRRLCHRRRHEHRRDHGADRHRTATASPST